VPVDPFAHHKAPIKKVKTLIGEGRGVQKTDEQKKLAKPSSIFGLVSVLIFWNQNILVSVSVLDFFTLKPT